MASINQVPEVLNDFRVYEEGSDNCLGVAKVELPSESVMTQTVKGVGIAGEVEAPVIGHYSSMETKLTWNTPTETTHRLTGGRGVRLEVRGAIQCWDSGKDKYVIGKPLDFIIGALAYYANVGSMPSCSVQDFPCAHAHPKRRSQRTSPPLRGRTGAVRPLPECQ